MSGCPTCRGQQVENRFVYLNDVPILHQGAMDMACGYYAALMLRLAWDENFAKTYWRSSNVPSNQLPAFFGTPREDCTPAGDGIYPGVLKKTFAGWTKEHRWHDSLFDSLAIHVQKGAPSILYLPMSAHQPKNAHYVVVKGYNPPWRRHDATLIVNDPLYGERELGTDALKPTTSSKKRVTNAYAWALVATTPTFLQRAKQAAQDGLLGQ